LAPVFASIVIAYLLNGMVNGLVRLRCPYLLSVNIAFVIFVGVFLLLLVWLLPLLSSQIVNLFNELPNMLTQGQTLLLGLPERYPEFVSAEQLTHIINSIKTQMAEFGQAILSFSLASIPSMIAVVVYLVLVPLLVFFLMKDRNAILSWTTQFLPHKRRLLLEVWRNVNDQFGNYIRGKIIELFIVAFISVIAFMLMGLQYAILLGVLVGFSVLIPFIGVAVVTVPVLLIAFLQWGWSPHFAYLAIIYTVIAVLDGNVLVPLLFSEAVSLHPIAIIIAVLFFGALWGFWGVFFAIPLGSVVNAVLEAWPTIPHPRLPETTI